MYNPISHFVGWARMNADPWVYQTLEIGWYVLTILTVITVVDMLFRLLRTDHRMKP